MASKRHRRPSCVPPPDGREGVLRRRACRHARKGDARKASIALRELVALTGEPRHWVALGDMLRRAGRPHQAVQALRQGLYLHDRRGADGRARVVAGLLLAVDPHDRMALRFLGTSAAA